MAFRPADRATRIGPKAGSPGGRPCRSFHNGGEHKCVWPDEVRFAAFIQGANETVQTLRLIDERDMDADRRASLLQLIQREANKAILEAIDRGEAIDPPAPSPRPVRLMTRRARSRRC